MTTSISRRRVLGAAATVGVAVPALAPAASPAAPVDPGLPAADDPNVLRVSTLGHDIDDSTEFLQAALDSNYATVVIDHVPGGWTTRPLVINRDDLRLVVEPDVMVRALPGGYAATSASMLTIRNRSNITISGYGATFAMNKPEYTSGEHRMVIRAYGCHDLTIEGLTVRDSGGDGIYLGAGTTPCRDVVIRDVVSDNNRRQGISVISAERLVIEGCALLNTNGTAPQSGIDFEPNTATERLTDVVMRDCVLSGNHTGGVRVSMMQLRETSHPVSILIERTTIGSQIGGTPQIMIACDKVHDFPGTFEVRDSLIDVSPGTGAFQIRRSGPGGLLAKLTRTSMWVWGNPFLVFGPMTLSSESAPIYGNLHCDQVEVHTDLPGPYLRTDGLPDTTVHNVKGTVTVSGPEVTTEELGDHLDEVTLSSTIIRPGDAVIPKVSVAPTRGRVLGGTAAEVRFTRTGDLNRSLAVAYETCGSARERYDYGGLGKVVVFEPGSREATLRIRTHQRRRSSDPARREIVVSVVPGRGYQVKPDARTLEIDG